MKNKLLLIGLIVVVAVARYAIGNYSSSLPDWHTTPWSKVLFTTCHTIPFHWD